MTRAPLDLPAVLDLAGRLGLTVGRGGFGPCPLCGAARRGRGDGRPPVGVFRGGRGWRCQAGGCDAGGDALALLAYARHGEQPPAGDPRWRGLLAELRGELEGGPAPRVSRPPPSTPAPDPGPDRAEVAALWAACTPVDADPRDPAARWLSVSRGLDVDGIAALDLARVLPAGKLPAWVPTLGIERETWRAVYRLAAPVYTAAGELAALRFRAVDRYPPDALDVPPPGCRFELRDHGRRVLVAPLWTPAGEDPREDRELPKALAARGCGRAAGLVLADPWGVALLRGQREAGGVRWSGLVVVVEGEPDLWAYAARTGRGANGETFAAFGVEAGSWTAAHAARIPDGARVLVATDDDAAGNDYAARIAATLTSRCKVRRERREHAEEP